MAINFADGTITLKMKMTSATGAEPKLISSTTPPIIVVPSAEPKESVYITG